MLVRVFHPKNGQNDTGFVASTRPNMQISQSSGTTWHRRCSAEWHSAVSRIGNPQVLDSSKRIVNGWALPNAIRRNSRLRYEVSQSDACRQQSGAI
jgi:hypothetical protein